MVVLAFFNNALPLCVKANPWVLDQPFNRKHIIRKNEKCGAQMTSTSPKLPSERSFGLMFGIIFAGVGLYGLFKGWSSAAVSAFIGPCLILAAVSIFVPRILAPFNRAWFHLGQLLGKIVSPIVLGIIFFGLITPVALICRMFGRDELKINHRSVSSFWIERDPPGPAANSFKLQF